MEKKGFFCTVYFVQRDFFNICVLSQCIVHWIHFQNRRTFIYQKTLLHTLLLLVFKTVKAFIVSLNFSFLVPWLSLQPTSVYQILNWGFARGLIFIVACLQSWEYLNNHENIYLNNNRSINSQDFNPLISGVHQKVMHT